ncbi:MAG TPA: copper resistance protein B [Allosphingosinicella sp.]|nr:copper resistance protein B [Allosphingosinicella sp.]
MASASESIRSGAVRAGAAALLLALAVPAGAQRLGYEQVWPVPAAAAAAAPRLGYESVGEDETEPLVVAAPAPSAAAAPAGADAEAGTGAVREYYFDRMEIGLQRGADGYAWDIAARIGGARNRIWLEAIGEGTLGGSLDYLELQALYSRPLSESWDVQAGLRYDVRPQPNRAWLMAGAQGNAGEPLYLGAFAFLSHRGELGARLYGLYDIGLPGDLVLQPSAEVNLFAQDIPELGLGRGLSYGEAGMRLRYEVREWFAPYVGVGWSRDFGRTARFTRAAGEDVSGRAFLIGLRSWF